MANNYIVLEQVNVNILSPRAYIRAGEGGALSSQGFRVSGAILSLLEFYSTT